MQQECRQLKSERLAGPGRHHGQEVLARQDGFNEFLLSVAKRGVSEMLMKGANEVVHAQRELFSSSRAIVSMLRIA